MKHPAGCFFDGEKQMITYYGYTISPNQLETDEGFLICRNVPIARTGDQDYLGTELGLNTAEIVKVHRPEEEVFSDATIASFEGKPVTDNHPNDLLDAETAMAHAKGHAQNVRRGTGKWKDYLVADLHIHDADLIREIRNGKKEVSCGYLTEYIPDGDGTYTQRNIRGNHVAIVENGRAGHEAAIMDSIHTQAQKPERKKMSKKSIWSTLFGVAAEGKTAEEISQLALDSMEAMDETVTEDAKPAEEPEKKEPAEDGDYKDKLFESIDALGGKIDKLCDALIPKKAEKDEDPIEAALKKMDDEAPAESEEAHVVPADEMDACKDTADTATVKAILTAVRPAIAEIKDEAQRKAVTDALLAAVAGKKEDQVKTIAETVQKNAAAKDVKTASVEEIQAAYDKLNPHKNKEGK